MVKDNSPRTVAVRVANFSEKDLHAVEVALTVGGKEVDSQKINLKAGGTVPVRFRHVFAHAGDNPGRIIVRHEDPCPEDNVFHFNARVIPRIKVLILNGRPSPRAREDAAFFVKAALAPTEDSPFEAQSLDAARVSAADIDGASVAILADVGTASGEARKALARLLARGGGVLFLPGESVEPEAFNRAFREYAPCRLRRILTRKAKVGGRAEATLTGIDFDHPIFQAFALPHHGDLGIASFFRYWEVTDSQLARVHARFDDGRPAILEREIGLGVSMMMVSPAELDWNDLPRHAVFLPLVHQIARHLAVRTERKTGYRVGETLPVPSGDEVRTPGGEALVIPEGDDELPAEKPGVYTVVDRGGKARSVGSPGRPDDAAEFRFAVNRDFAEADPAPMDADEIVAAVESVVGTGAAGGRAGAAEERGDPDADELNIWWYVMLALAALTMGELFLGNRTQRH